MEGASKTKEELDIVEENISKIQKSLDEESDISKTKVDITEVQKNISKIQKSLDEEKQ